MQVWTRVSQLGLLPVAEVLLRVWRWLCWIEPWIGVPAARPEAWALGGSRIIKYQQILLRVQGMASVFWRFEVCLPGVREGMDLFHPSTEGCGIPLDRRQ